MVKAIESKSKEHLEGKDLVQKQFSDLKEQHIAEIQSLTLQHAEAKASLESQLEALNEKYQELELKHTLLQNELSQETDILKNQVESLETARQRAVDMNRTMDSQKLKMLEDAEQRHKAIIE